MQWHAGVVLAMGLVLSFAPADRAYAQSPSDLAPPGAAAFDPASVLSILGGGDTDTRAAGPFLGLAAPPRVEEPSGAAVTSIPIDLPRGRNGLTPDVLVAYSSNAGNGPLGIGWTLSIGAVRRATHDGVPFIYEADPQNPFRYPVPGDVTPGEYVLELRGAQIRLDRDLGTDCGHHVFGSSTEEAFLRVWFDPAANTWTVTDKSGIRYTYGAAGAETRAGFDVTAATGTFAWGLTRIEDPNGNAVTFSYAPYGLTGPLNRALYPQFADYAGVYRVEIGYEARTDAVPSYAGGFEHRLERRVSAIQVIADGTTVRTHRFSYEYEATTRVSRLVLVEAHSGAPDSPGLWLPSTSFTYASAPSGFGGDTLVARTGSSPQGPWIRVWQTAVMVPELDQDVLDMDGDALPDVAISGPDLTLVRNTGSALEAGPPWPYTAADHIPRVHGWDMDHRDMNGDALPDEVAPHTASHCNDPPYTACEWLVGFNNGSGFDPALPWRSPPPPWTAGTASQGMFDIPSSEAATVELNGDRRPDRLYCNQPDPQCIVFLNSGTGFAETAVGPWYYPFGPLPHLSEGQITWADMNGDGLTDVVYRGPSAPAWDVYLNTGRGFAATPEAWALPGFSVAPAFREGSTTCTDNAYVERKLFDMNGDGRLDYVDSGPNPWRVYYNTGREFVGPVNWTGTSALGSAPDNWMEWWPGQSCFNQPATDVVDFNGDGIADWLVGDGGDIGAWTVRFGQRRRVGELVRLDNGLGASHDIAYTAATTLRTGAGGTGPTSYCVAPGHPTHGKPCNSSVECGAGSCAADPGVREYLPFPTHVVTGITIATGFSGTGNSFTSTYQYGYGFYDPEAVEFRGFEWVVATDAERNRRTETRYVQPADPFDPGERSAVRPLKAKPDLRRVVDGATSQALITTAFGWNTTPATGGRTQVNLSWQTTTYSAGGTSQAATWAFTYDAYNNPRLAARSADGQTISLTQTDYAYDSARYVVDRPISIASGPSGPRRREFSYDDRGNATTLTECVDAPGCGQPLVTTVAYDGAGMPTVIVDPRGNPMFLSYGCNAGLYPCAITNALGQVTSYIYDLQWGKPAEVIDPNGAATQVVYDELGRPIAVLRSLDTIAWRLFEYTFGSGGTPSRILTYVREPSALGGYRQESAFFDSVGRRLETKREDVVNGTDTVVVVDAVRFDAAGRVQKRAAPFTSMAPIENYAAPSGSYTTVEYDVLDRPTKTTFPDGTFATAAYPAAGTVLTKDENATAAEQGITANVSGQGRQVEEFRDALGRVLEVREYDGQPTAGTLRARTVNEYDGQDRLLVTTAYDDATGRSAQTRFAYDPTGRRTQLVDADSGTWEYRYDGSGNLIFQNDPKAGQHLEFCYDPLNRLRCTYGVDGDGPSQPAISCGGGCPVVTGAELRAEYHYDACANGMGRLCQVADRSGSTAFAYDLRGRTVSSEKRIVAGGFDKAFTFTQAYDAADRLRTTTYPTNSGTETLTYVYDAGGRLASASTPGTSFLGYAKHDQFGRVTEEHYGDSTDVYTTWTYAGAGSRFRLDRIKTRTGAGSTRQNFAYGPYDKAGNLLRITDPNGYGYGDADPRDNDWQYTYDGLGRLTQATAPNNGEWGSGGFGFGYDRLGNLTARGDLAMTHDPAFPHRVTTSTPASGPAYAYDANGALTTRPDTDGSGQDVLRAVTYDREGRVARLTVGDPATAVLEYVYDYAGQVVARLLNDVPTLYFGDRFEVTGNQLTRHIYAGSRRIAQSTVTLSASSPLLLARLDPRARGIALARLLEDTLRRNPRLYPEYVLAAEDAAKLGALLALALLLVARWPGRVRVGLAAGRQAPFRQLQRGTVLVVATLFGLSLTPLTCVRSARATGGGGGPPPPPTFRAYFVHADHLGSTTLLTCYQQGTSCADGTPRAYFRYDPYGTVRAYDAAGAAPVAGAEPTDRLYTGQRWEWSARTYDYGARVYDPRLARFLTIDPAREYVNPYAYVRWNPLRFIDPTGMVFGSANINFTADGPSMPPEWSFDCMVEARTGRPGFPVGLGAPGDQGGELGLVGVLIALHAAVALLAAQGVGAALSVVGGLGGGFLGGLGGGLVGSLTGGISGGAAGFALGFAAGSMVGRAVGSYLTASLINEVLDIAGAVNGHLGGVEAGVSKLAAGNIREGLWDIATAATPRLGSHGGLNHPGENPLAFESTSQPNLASIDHDNAMARGGVWNGFLRSEHHFRWIANSFAGPGVQAGPYGQAFRLVGTAAFGIAGGALWLSGR